MRRRKLQQKYTWNYNLPSKTLNYSDQINNFITYMQKIQSFKSAHYFERNGQANAITYNLSNSIKETFRKEIKARN